jgi:hypothetical protein
VIAAAYDDEITDEQLRSLPGAGDAASVRVLKRQLDEGDVENVVEEPQEPAAYDDDHGRAADAVLERTDELTTRCSRSTTGRTRQSRSRTRSTRRYSP